MQAARLDAVVVTQHAHVQWLTGCWFSWVFQPAAALLADGTCLLVAPERKLPEIAAADKVIPYEAQWRSTLRNDQRAASTEALKQAWGKPLPRRLGVEFSSFGPHAAAAFSAELVDIEPDLYRLRRFKHPDELAMLQKAIDATGAMYAHARRIVAPGANELDVFNQLQSVAVAHLGEMLTGTGNDYASNARGGPPRDRKTQAGELYILDLGPAYRGYFADNCRTLAVDRKPTDAQYRTWERVASVFALVEKEVRPGLSCRQFFRQVQEHLDAFMPGSFDHHLGHGIGLFPHEGPHLNPRWDDVFEAGDVFAVEPGLYGPELRAGIRLENNYLVTDGRVKLLSDFPLEL
ncbi:MAG: aminopeptidase P family protein [Planctomycetia bacterium]|nr:aminopeptidase P family protein [Planctomycetia bacterium]